MNTKYDRYNSQVKEEYEAVINQQEINFLQNKHNSSDGQIQPSSAGRKSPLR